MNPVTVMPGAESFYLKGKNGKGVLLLHGFTGNPCEMRYLGERLHAEGYTVYAPRYPGHGTNINEMLNSSAEDWMISAREAFIELSSVTDEVFVAGLSMGGLFTILIAREFEPEKIALISTPKGLENPVIYLSPVAGIFKKIITSEDSTKGINSPELRESHVCYGEGLPVKQSWQLYRYIKKAMRALPEVRSKAVILQSTGDVVIPAASADYIYDRIAAKSKKKFIFRKSNHVLINDYDREEAASIIIDYFRSSQ